MYLVLREHRGIGANIHYLGPPEGLELPPFLETLSQISETTAVGEVTSSAELLVFVASGCPHCPHAARAALTLALLEPAVTCFIADAQHNAALAERFGVRSVPFTLLDQALSWTGALTAEQIRRRIRERGTRAHQVATLRAMIESRRLEAAAAIVQAGSGPETFARLWKESTAANRGTVLRRC